MDGETKEKANGGRGGDGIVEWLGEQPPSSVGSAPQAAVLAYPAIGGFVSHCRWNSNLESIWFDVAMVMWPLYEEQQFNAFELVAELDLATEIKMDYGRDLRMECDIVMADKIEAGIRKLMKEAGGERQKKVKEVSKKSQKALVEGDSSYLPLGSVNGGHLEQYAMT
ncbi:anthocyanidin 3-O-glucosyltransferase 2-like [Eucalyptus grandis]|uniref:anthocyanidin 3-O-glucosyltransferase 2-like n=1 Tax=Eucalyptus grandis TaxID=71139 RepID=UPI00192EAFEC|nr:anthocyanidin 3-O-glucosyltransferase 2-like [Eucalyptus grandis]